MRKAGITVIGAGDVGAATAHRLAEGLLGDVVLIDSQEGVAQGKALDLGQAAAVLHNDCFLTGATDFGATSDSDIIVMTAGFEDAPVTARADVVEANAIVVADAIGRAVKGSRDAIIVMVTNPVEVMCEVARRVSGFPRQRIVGMAGIVDAARIRQFIALGLGVSVDNVSAIVLGGHGDSMVPIPRYTTVSGVPITELLPKDRIDAIVKVPRTAPNTHATAAGVFEMVDSIVRDRKKILPCSAYLMGELGLSDVWMGVPCTLGAGGMEGVFELMLIAEERAALVRAAAEVKAQIARIPVGLGLGGGQ